MSHATPIVFVVDDDVSVRESLELLIRNAGWEPETFASAQEFLSRHRGRVMRKMQADSARLRLAPAPPRIQAAIRGRQAEGHDHP
jgi:DNA-binding NtrC family response regulator